MIDSELTLDLPYITNESVGIGGQLRATPEHFVVEELPLYEPQGEGQHLYVNLTKVGVTTKEVQLQLARLFGIRPTEVGFAGMKDKVARTTQTFSLSVGHKAPTFSEEAAERIRAAVGVEVNWTRFHTNKLRSGHLLGNRFTITVSELACGVEEALVRARQIADLLAVRGVPNFFGPQRFGSSGANPRQGLAILLGDRGPQDRWLRKFLVSAFQSYLCNRYLCRRIELGAFDQILEGDVAKKHATGGMFSVEDVATDQPRFVAQEISFTAPMYGPKMWAATGAAAELEEAVLAETSVTLDHFGRARVEGTRRMGRLLMTECEIAAGADGDGVTLSFTLPKGAFATTILREFMKVELAQTPEVDEGEGE
jgi:tRNA pseudouridine13 synthase